MVIRDFILTIFRELLMDIRDKSASGGVEVVVILPLNHLAKPVGGTFIRKDLITKVQMGKANNGY